MPTVEARIFFYDITEAGYYQHGETAPAFGSIDEALSALSSWRRRNGRLVSETATYEVGENSRITLAYCVGVERDAATGDYLVTTWNCAETFDGEVASISDSPAGRAKVFKTPIPEGIPGYPSHFWIFPKHGLYACVQFSRGGRNGRGEFEQYMRGFLRHFTRYTVYTEGGSPAAYADAAEREIAGYRDPSDPGSAPPGRVYPRWRSHRLRHAGKLEQVRSSRAQVVKVIRKTVLGAGLPRGKSRIHKAFDLLTGRPSVKKEPPDQVKITLAAELTPTSEELEAIIADWQNQPEESTWNDAGFVLKGSQQELWLSHSNPRVTLALELATSDPLLISGEALLRALSKERGHVLRRALAASASADESRLAG